MAQPENYAVHYDLRPTYYDKFQCLAGDCRHTCCQGWHITFDKKDYLALKRVNGSPELNERMKLAVHRIKKGYWVGKYYGEFVLPQGCCFLHRTDGLCQLQLEKGHSALPEVCQIFPRGKRYSDSFYLERNLSPACEGVLELLWNLPDGVDFVSDPLSREERCVGSFDPDSLVIRSRYQDIRAQCIDFLQDRRCPLSQRVLLMGVALKELADGETDVDRWLNRARALAGSPELVQALQPKDPRKALPMFLLHNLKTLYESADLRSEFASVPDEICENLHISITATEDGQANVSASDGPYLAARARFEERFKDRAYFLENLMVSIFFNLGLPNLGSTETLWKSYVSFCSLYSFFRFMAVASCREGASGDKDELFRLMVCASRGLLHNGPQQTKLRDEFFQNDSATLAHMAILLSG